ncbi:MAG TPA: acetate/propionate family kinase, partial [Spirochaetales bacterium]|nr:acetate/propionate family kinase [Spirochaetales bacterium]
MVILTLNCGSSSVKYQVYDWDEKNVLASGIVERVGIEGSIINHKAPGVADVSLEHECPNHVVAVELILKTITDPQHGVVRSMKDIGAVGHRMVHGGMKFARSVLITDESLATFKELIDLAPLHNPANITGVEAAKAVLPNVPHCAVMDTAWHQTMPSTSYTYALPHEWQDKYMVRRYGFHGTSFLYTAKRASVLLGKDPFDSNVIIAHIGNGSSINAVKDGCSYDTSMGMTPLEGLVMGTRSGDIDPGIVFHMMKKAGLSAAEVEKALNKESGVLGITGRWSDRRDIENAAAEGDRIAIVAQELEGYR